MAETPTLDKMREVQERSQAIGEFLDWLSYEQHVHLMVFDEDMEDVVTTDQRWRPYHVGGTERLLALYFGIDLDKAESEKRAVLEEFREKTAAS